MKNIKMKNLLSENMRRFNTKNLNEQLAKPPSNSKNSDLATVRVMQFLRAHGATDNELKTGLKIDQQELDRLDNLSVDIKQADQHAKNAMGILTKFPLLALRVEQSGIKAKSDLIMMYSEMGRTEEVAIILYFIRSERDAEIVSTYIKNRTKMDLYNFLQSKFSPIEMTTRYIGDVSIINSLRRLKVYTVTTNLKEEYNSDQFSKFNDDMNNSTPIKAKIKIGGETGVITLTSMGKIRSGKYNGILSDNGGISSIQVLNGQNVILGNFPKTSEWNYISNTTGKEEIETNTGMQDSIIFQFIEFV